jgi:hypothetical protein
MRAAAAAIEHRHYEELSDVVILFICLPACHCAHPSAEKQSRYPYPPQLSMSLPVKTGTLMADSSSPVLDIEYLRFNIVYDLLFGIWNFPAKPGVWEG